MIWKDQINLLSQSGAGTVEKHADVLDGFVQLLGHLAVAKSFQAMQAKHVGLLRRQVDQCGSQSLRHLGLLKSILWAGGWMQIDQPIDGTRFFGLRCGLTNPAAQPIDRPGSRQPNQQASPIPNRLPQLPRCGCPGKFQRRGERFLETFIGVGPVSQQPMRGPPNSRPIVAHNHFPIDLQKIAPVGSTLIYRRW